MIIRKGFGAQPNPQPENPAQPNSLLLGNIYFMDTCNVTPFY